ncbi:four helix bundle protein [Myxococcota bacterium]|jgi:hypothetical protein|nr:four helix bundle protein [Myxococcota bacterium]
MQANELKASPAAVVEVGYQAFLWLDERVAGFPRDARRALGHRLTDAALAALAATTEANYMARGPARTERLATANRQLAVARILLRAARDRHHLSVAQHEYGIRLLDGWGRQVGGWLRAEQVRGQP